MMMIQLLAIAALLTLGVSACAAESGAAPAPELATVIARGDITRDAIPEQPVPLYQGNGVFGSTYGVLGLHVHPDAPAAEKAYGNTQFMHLKHFVRAKHNADYLLGLARMYWERPPANLDSYRQHQSFYDGTIKTAFSGNGQDIIVTSWFDRKNPDIAGFVVDVKGGAPSIILAPIRKIPVHYRQEIDQDVKIVTSSHGAKITLTALGKSSDLFLETNATVDSVDEGLRLTLKPGVNTILLSANAPPATSANESLDRNIAEWHGIWSTKGWLDLPAADAQKVWVRSLAYILSSASDVGLGMTPPCGLSGNQWPFPFPQDLSYIHPVLLTHGHLDIARSWIEYWAKDVARMQEYTRRLLKTDGIFMPWVYPYGDIDGYHDPGPPNIFYYGLHNSGYIARMACETGVMLNDIEWTRKNVLPLIEQTAKFYRSCTKREDDGFWHLFLKPSVGQDELGGQHQKDYLCALYSAQYCFQKAIEHGLDPDGAYRRILDDGLAIPKLMSERGLLYSCAGTGPESFGKQKHFVQLNPLTFLPLYDQEPKEVAAAFLQRYEINERSREPYFYGWTGGQILLAATRHGDPVEWTRDWNSITKGCYLAPDFIAAYETSGLQKSLFFVTTHGLLAQSLSDNVVCSWWGKITIGQCIPWDSPVRFGNLRSPLGVIVSGQIDKGNSDVELRAWKDCEFEINGRRIKLAKGDTKAIKLPRRN